MLSKLIIDETKRFNQAYPTEQPYAFAIIQGQQCNYLGYAVATFQALDRTVAKYLDLGYRYQGADALPTDEALRAWLKWANPDDGWYFCDFVDQDNIQAILADCDHDDSRLRSLCIEHLKEARAQSNLTFGVTTGEDPEDFRQSVIEIYGQSGHLDFIEEFNTMLKLEGHIQYA